MLQCNIALGACGLRVNPTYQDDRPLSLDAVSPDGNPFDGRTNDAVHSPFVYDVGSNRGAGTPLGSKTGG